MLHDLESLNGSAVIASDGEIGRVSNFLLDDQSWTIRYLVVDVGNWLARHSVVLAISAVEQPDWEKKIFRVNLTREQVRHSPDVDAAQPVSRQQEIAMKEYFKWPAYWEDVLYSELTASPTGMEYPLHTKGDAHLRSAWALAGYQVWSADEAVGHLQNFIMDDASWHLGYLDIKAGDWLHQRSVLVPTEWVKSISWAKHRLYLRGGRESL